MKQRILHGLKTIGQYIVAMAALSSFLRNLINLYFSVAAPGFVSCEKRGLLENLRKPQWNSIRVFEGTASLFSVVRLILKCIVESFVSWGNKVDKITAWFIAKLLTSSFPISSTIVR